MRDQSNPWIAVATSLAVCLPAAGLLIVTGLLAHETFTPGPGGQIPDWLWTLGRAIGGRGILVAFFVAAGAVSAVPIAMLLNHWRGRQAPSFSDHDVRRVLGRVPPHDQEVEQQLND
jgi:hypothetical protein